MYLVLLFKSDYVGAETAATQKKNRNQLQTEIFSTVLLIKGLVKMSYKAVKDKMAEESY